MDNAVLLDTCAVIWLVNADPMSGESRGAIRRSHVKTLGVYVSPISAWEIGTLAAKRKLQLSVAPEAWFAGILSLPGIRLAEMPPELLIASAFLPGVPPRDPADRILAATAREHDLTIITRDGELLAYAKQGHIKAMRC